MSNLGAGQPPLPGPAGPAWAGLTVAMWRCAGS